jgi:outer membrane protein TolC
VPLSGRSQSGGAVQSQQTSTGSGTSSINTINSTVQVTGSYQGSVSGPATYGVLKLTVAEAIRRGLLYNLGTVGASASLKQARGRRLSSLSQMLPNIYGSLAENGAKADLQAEGLTPSLFSGSAGGGFSLPTTVGPYHYYSAQANAEESVSLTGFYNVRTANASLHATEFDGAEARELIVLAVGGTYLRLLASKANVMAEEGEVKQVEESYKQTAAEFEAGVKDVIDNNKSLIQFRTEQERLSSLRSDLIKQTMQLARIIGLPPGQRIEFQEDLPEGVPDAQTLGEAIQQAIK